MQIHAICVRSAWTKRRRLTQTLLVMKLSVLLLLAGILNASAKGVSQTISFTGRNVSLEKVLDAVEKQSGFNFFYNEKCMLNSRSVSVRANKMELNEFLQLIFADQPLTYYIENKNVIISRKPTSIPVTAPDIIASLLPLADIRGRIQNEKGEPVIASISIKGTRRGTTSDAGGYFELKNVNENDILVITSTSIETREIKLTDDAGFKAGFFNIQVKTVSAALSEIVFIGYGIQKKSNLTGAVAQLSGAEVTNRALTNIGQGLQGKIGNLNITTTADPGGPGTPSSFNVRGTTSLNGGGPMFLVDGVPVSSIDNINPNDVESITVLKDAASSAIYGARAAYGVILITTKKGKKGDAIAVTYGSMASWSSPTVLPEMANSLEFAETYNVASTNSGLAAPFGPDQIDRIKRYMADPNSVPVTTPDPNAPNYWSYDNANGNTDWFREYVKPVSFNQKHDLAISGGGKSTSYYTSFGLLDQGGQLRYGDDKFRRMNLTSNVHSEPTSWMRFDVRMRFASSKTDYPFPYANLTGNWFHLAGTRLPIWPVRNPDGKLSNISAIPFFNSGGRSVSTSNDLWLTGAVELEPVKNWKINIDYTLNQQGGKTSNHSAFVYAYAIDGTKYNIGSGQNSIAENAVQNEYNSFNAYTSYEKRAGRHFIKGLVGQQLEVSKFFSLSGTRYDLITDAISSMGVATGQQFASDAISHWATTGTFVRLNYNFDEKFLVEFNGRYDGTSKFPADKRFGFFPSVSAGYNIAKEEFWPFKDEVSQFKIRGSYGSLGNQSVANYLYLSPVPIYTNLGYILNNQRPNYLSMPGLKSSDLTWETARTKDIGLDVTMLKNRLDLTFDVYSRSTINMLGPAEALPATLGTSVPLMNNANLVTRGFELNVSWKDKVGPHFDYHVSLVLSDYKAKVTKYNNPTNILSTYYKGLTIGEIWGWRSSGLIQTDQLLQSMPDQSFFYGGQWYKGDLLYQDLNKDGKVDYGDYTTKNSGDFTVIGNNTPRYTFGINAGFDWKGFDFNMFWQGVGKRDAWLGGTIFYGLLGEYGSAVWKNTLDYWTPEHTNAYWPRPYNTGEILKNRAISSRYLQNLAYARLKNIQLGYSLPQRLIPKIHIQRIRLFVSGENLLTFSKVNSNFDPEVTDGRYGSGKIYPLMKTATVGLNVEF